MSFNTQPKFTTNIFISSSCSFEMIYPSKNTTFSIIYIGLWFNFLKKYILSKLDANNHKSFFQMKKNPTVELKLPILKDMELVATHTSDVVSKHMNLSEDKSAEVSMALIEACINAFEHSETKEDIYIHFIISDENLTIKVIDKGVGFDSSSIKLPNIDDKLGTQERKRGWGLMLIQELMDKVDYESDNSGTTLTMTKNKESDE